MAVNVVHGTSGDDNLTGTGGDDTFQLGQGGNDHAQGLGGNDIFNFAGTLTAADTIDGGTGNDLVRLNGDYAAGITLGATTLTSVETLQVLDGFSYKLTTVDGNVAAGQTLAVDAGTLSAGHALTFDGSAETDGSFRFTGGAGNDDLTGGARADSFHLEHGGEDTAHGGAGNDIFVMGASFDAGDRLDGGFDSGAASNVLRLDGDYSAGVTLDAATIANIYTLQFDAGHDYKIVADAASFLSGPTVNIEGGQLGAGNSLTFDGSASDANFNFIAGAGNDVLTGGSAFDIFDLSKGGNDTVTGGGSRDIFRFGSTLTASDHIDGGAGNDSVDMDGMGATDAITFGAGTFTSVETLYLAAGHAYTLTTVDGNVAAGATLLVNGADLGSTTPLIFNGAAETDGHFTIRGGAAGDTLTGGAQSDTFNLTLGGSDTVNGSGGNDTFNMGGSFDAGDQIDGGSGNDTLSLNGTYATPITVSGTMVQNVETVSLVGNGYNIAWQSAIASTLTVDASTIGSGISVIFDSSALATGDVHLIAGAGQTSFTGGGGDDVVDLQNSGDGYRVSAGDGDDTVNFGAQYGTSLPFLDFADGNGGSNTATFDGDYASGLTLGVQSFFILSYGLTDFQTVELLGDHSYTVTFDDSQDPGVTLTGGAALTVDASALGAGDHAVLDFSLSAAPTFTVTGGAGDDTVTFAANFAAGDAIDGGAGNDTLELNADYSAGFTFGAATLTSVETLKLDAGHSYALVTNDGNVASGKTLAVDASALGAGDTLTFDGSAETNGLFAITGGAGDDSVTFGSHYSVSDTFDGGAGNDTVTIKGHGTLVFSATTLTNVEDLIVNSGVINITTNDATVASGATLTVDFSPSNSFGIYNFDGSAEADGHFHIIGPANATGYTVTGGALSDTFTLGNDQTAGNTINGGGGNDTLTMTAAGTGFTFNGGADNDTLALTGGGTIGSNQIHLTGVESLTLDDHNWTVTAGDTMVQSGATLAVDAGALTATHSLAFDGSGETDGFFAITGGAGDDSVAFGNHFSVSDSIDGGAGNDTVTLTNINGHYNFTATTIANVEDLVVTFKDNSSVNSIRTTDANVAAGATMTVDFSGSGAAIGLTDLTFDGSAEQDGHFNIIAPHHSDFVTITGGALSDSFTIAQLDGPNNTFTGLGGDDTVTMASDAFGFLAFAGGSGNDTVALTGGGAISGNDMVLTSVENMTFDDHSWNVTLDNGTFTGTLNVDATALTAGHTFAFDGSQVTGGAYAFTFAGNFVTGDSLTGGAGSDTLSLNGDYTSPLVMGASTISAIETITVADGHSYDIVSNNANVASGATLTVDGSALTGGNTLSFSGSAELDGHFAFIGGAGADVLEGGSQSDTFDLGLSDGAFVNGGGGSDTFTVTSRAFLLDDFIDGSAGSDTLVLNGNFSTATALTGSNIEDIDALTLLGAANSYNLAFTDGITTSLTVNASAAASLTFDATGDTATSFTITGSAGNDTLTGGGLNDGFNLTLGGNDTAHGGAGNDTFSFGGAFTAADTVDGGANSDTISLNGDYSTALTLGAATLTSVETIVVQAGHNYDLIANDANVAAAATLNVTASSLGAGDTLTVDGSAETDGHFAFTGGAGNDTLTGGAQSDSFDLTTGGTDTVHGGGGSDTITLGSSFSAADAIDGGTGSDTVNLVNVTGTYSFTATTIQNVEDLAITVTDGHSGSFTTNDANVAAGATMIVDFSSSGPAFGVNALTFDGSAETDGHFAFVEPNSVSIMSLTGGALSDTLSFNHGDGGDNAFNGLGGDDTATTTANASRLDFDGGTGNDTLAFTGGGLENHDYIFTSVENVTFDDNDWTVSQRFQGASVSLNVDATALSGGHTLTFNGVDTTDGPGFADESFVFEFAGNFIAGDSLTGNTGNDTLSLNGNYSGGFTFGANTISSIETIAVAAGHSYDLVTNDANVAAGATLTVDGSALLAGTTLDFNGSNELDGHFAFISGAGADDLQGGAQSDTFDLSRTTTANAFGNGGNDSFTVTSAAMIANGFIDGGAGSDTLILNGDFSTQTQITASTVTSIETLQLLGAANSYNLAIGGGVGFAATLTIDASAASSLTLDTSGGGTTDYAITGSANADSITFTSRTVLLGSTIDGGAGSDTLTLNGNFGTTSTLTATTFTNVEKIVFGVQTTNYGFVSNDANIASGKTLTLDGTALTHALNWDGSAETDGFFAFTGGAGNDSFTIGAASVLAGSTIDGGTGSQNNFLVLNGDYSAAFTFTAAEMSNIQNLTLDRNHSYHLTTVDANVAAGSHLSVNGLALVSTDTIYFNGSAETDGLFTLQAGQGNDTLIGGAGNDTIFGYLGADTMTGGAGADTFTYTFAVGSGVAESTSTGYDTITDINFSVDRIDPPGANGTVTGVDSAIVGGALSTASFDADLAAAVNSGTLAVAHAVLFTANSGTLSGHTFLVVDENGTAGYQASADLVIDVTGYSGTLTTGSFV